MDLNANSLRHICIWAVDASRGQGWKTSQGRINWLPEAKQATCPGSSRVASVFLLCTRRFPPLASSRSGFPFTFGNLNFWRLAAGSRPLPPRIFFESPRWWYRNVEVSRIPILAFFFFFFFFFLRGVNPFLAPNGTIESPSNWKYWKHFAKSLAKIIPARRIELERWLLWIDHIVYRFRIGIVEFELLLIPLLCRAIFLVILSV